MSMAGASKNTPDQIAGCQGKTAFLGACGAYRALKSFTRRRKFKRERGERVEPYLCKTCGKWHIGSALK